MNCLDILYDDAKEIVLRDKNGSISYIQRKLVIGYNRASNIMDQLEKNGIVSVPDNNNFRTILDH